MGWLVSSLHRVSRNTQLFFRRRKAKKNLPQHRSRVLTIVGKVLSWLNIRPCSSPETFSKGLASC